MTSLRYINTMEGDRSMYIEDGQMMFITEYHKSIALMDEVKCKDSSIQGLIVNKTSFAY